MPTTTDHDWWSFSYGYQPRSIETRLAARLAQARGLDFDAFVIPRYLPTKLPLALATVEGFQDVTHSRQLGVAGPLAERADTVIAAHWGDVWLDDMGWPGGAGSRSAIVDHTLGRLAKRGSDWLLRHVCARHSDVDPRAWLRQGIGEDLDRLAHIDDPDFRIKAFKTDHWSFRWTLASVRAYQAAAFPRLPFYDPRLVDFFTTVPTAFVAGRRLEIDYLRRRAPQLARVPWQHTGMRLGVSAEHAAWRTLPRRAALKLWRALRRQRVVERNIEIQVGGGAGQRLLEQHLLAPGLAIHDVVDRQPILELVEDFKKRPEGHNSYALGMLLTFASWLETRF